MSQTEQYLAEVRYMIDNQRLVKRLCEELVAACLDVHQRHAKMGFQGMAHRSTLLTREAPEEYGKLRDEYTEIGLETAKALVRVYNMIDGIRQGLDESIQAKAQIEN